LEGLLVVEEVFLGDVGEVGLDLVELAHLRQRGDVVFQFFLLLPDG
jgi:hypothetical protein